MQSFMLRLCTFLALLLSFVVSHQPHYHGLMYNQAEFSAQEVLRKFVSSNLVSTGTTIVGICCRDGVVLGADTRSTGGPLVMDKNKLKIHTLAQKILCCAAGTSAVCDHLSRRVNNRLALDNIGIHKAATEEVDCNTVDIAAWYISEELLKMAKSDEDEDASQPKAVFILGGMDKDGPKLYQIEYESTPCRIAYGSLGSGSTDAIAILESSLQTLSDGVDIDQPILNLSVEEGIEIVRKAVKAGIMNDLGSGSHVDLCVITETSTKQWRELSTEELRSQRSKNRQEVDEVEEEESKSTGLQFSEILGRRVWRPRTSRLIFQNEKLIEQELPEYSGQTPITIQLLPDE